MTIRATCLVLALQDMVMMPAHIAHVDPEGYYTFTNGRLNKVFPGRPSDILGEHIADALGPAAYGRIAPHLDAAYQGESPVFEFTEDQDSRRLRVAFTPDQQGGAFILSMDVTEETQTRVALQQARKREIAAQMTSGSRSPMPRRRMSSPHLFGTLPRPTTPLCRMPLRLAAWANVVEGVHCGRGFS